MRKATWSELEAVMQQRDDLQRELDHLEDKLAETLDGLSLIKQWAKDLHLSHGKRPLGQREILASLERICESAEMSWEAL